MKKQFQLKMVSAAVAVGLMAAASVASAQVVGGGATLPERLYGATTAPTGIFVEPSLGFTDFSYTGVGSGGGKAGFLNNNPASINSTAPNVHFAGSDSVLSASELSTYEANRLATWGPLIQVPAAGTSVVIPFNKAGSNEVNLLPALMCRIFAGTVANWSQIPGSGRSGPITVVYRAGSSGTTELFTRYLTAACSGVTLTSSTLKPDANGTPRFATTSTFAQLFVNNTPPANFIEATGSQGVIDALGAAEGRITYISPDFIEGPLDGDNIARVRGAAPTTENVIAALGTSAPPSGAARDNPANWVPTFANPSQGYPIVGYTNFIVGQCYQNPAVQQRILDLIEAHVFGDFDAKVVEHRFIPLPPATKAAILQAFVEGSDGRNLNVGNATECNGVGRPS
ncbi:substrate-binding domain-containing protein [Orrella sp. JC864]|uniref:substrate-binding domain-containing protein n=1 Tax=Orrella sp. JC864 TaxID=3120298 RepID=UPI003008ADD6